MMSGPGFKNAGARVHVGGGLLLLLLIALKELLPLWLPKVRLKLWKGLLTRLLLLFSMPTLLLALLLSASGSGSLGYLCAD
jgi:hypothetical protein